MPTETGPAQRQPTPPNRLKSLREAQGLDRKALAAQITSRYGGERGAGRDTISDRTVRRWESGEVPIPNRYWVEVADLFRVSVAHLLGLDGEPTGDGIRKSA